MKKIFSGSLFFLVMLLTVLLYSCEITEDSTDQTPPEVTGAITSSDITSTGVTLSWEVASDDITAVEALEYKIVKSLDSTLVDTVEEADEITGNGLVMDWTPATLTKEITGLSNTTSYYFSVLVRDEAGNMALYAPFEVTTPEPTTRWAWTLANGTNLSIQKTAMDAQKNIFAVGYISNSATINFGNDVSATGPNSYLNPLIVKYDSSGVAQWAKTVTSTTTHVYFVQISLDDAGNIYAIGFIPSSGGLTINFGDGISIISDFEYHNTVVVKYNSEGTTQWAKFIKSQNTLQLDTIVADSTGNVYAGGYFSNNQGVDLGEGVTATGSATNTTNLFIAKYNSTGIPQWARSVSEGTGSSMIRSVTADTGGNVYAVGHITGNMKYNFGDGVAITGASSNMNPVLVKYSSSGVAQWVKTTYSTANSCNFNSIGIDPSGNIYAGGGIAGNAISYFDENLNVSVTGTSSTTSNSQILLVKYDSSGTAQWATCATPSVTAGSGCVVAIGSCIIFDSEDNIYLPGTIFGGYTYTFADGVAVTGKYNGGDNILLVKYDPSGVARWARTLESGSNLNRYYSTRIYNDGSIYGIGTIVGTGLYNFGDGITAQANAINTSATSQLVVRYR